MGNTVSQVKCACSDCVCVVGVDGGVKSEGRVFCCEACAEHHKGGAGCHHAGCTCHG